VRKMPYKTWLLAGFLLLMPWAVYAAGLGKLTIVSALGQPLLAEIDLVSVQKDELSTVSARIASPDAFSKANIQYNPALNGARLSIERRSDGQSYIKVVSSRIINEPFINLLIELSWAQGRIVREYTALIDPPAAPAEPALVTPPVAAAPPAAVESTPIAPPVAPAVPAAQPPFAAAEEPKPAAKSPSTARAAPTKSDAKDYSVVRGDTLYKIANEFKPEGVTVEQMLLSLYRGNPEAFVGNMNRLKAGKILRIPEKEQISATGQAEAKKEIRVQTADWKAYRQKLADAAGATPARESKPAASGKITTAVEDKAAGKEPPKEVLKLSKGEQGKAGGKQTSDKDRVRALEEESTARGKALAEANERVAQLEKNIKDMQRLLELKGQAPGAKPAPQPAPGMKPEAAPPPAKADQVTKADATKAQPPAKTEPPKVEPVKAEAPKMESAKDAVQPPVAEAPKAEQKAAPAEAPKEAPKAVQPKAPPKIVAPPPEPDLVGMITGNPVYLGGIGGGILVLGGVGFWLMRRRRGQSGDDGLEKKTAPKLAKSAATSALAAAAPAIPPGPPAIDDVDPLAEADLYLNFGRDAQAEEVLKEALSKNPTNEAAQLKLLQIYAGRKDKGSFEKVAKNLHAQTRGAGDNWLKAAAMGCSFDPDNALYEAGKSAPAVAMPAAGSGGGTDLDLDLMGGGGGATATDIDLDSGVGTSEKTTMMRPGEMAAAAAPVPHDSTVAIPPASAAPVAAVAPDFTLNIPGADSAPAAPVEEEKPAANMIDFNFDAPAAAAPAAPSASGLGMDFDLGSTSGKTEAPAGAPAIPDLKLDDISLNLDDAPKAAPAEGGGGAKDDHWYDVQTKFDLAKAYQEMGDKDGAREILQEVIKEGDSGQQAEAKKLLDSLS
jgi:pilus assembly protein FimV